MNTPKKRLVAVLNGNGTIKVVEQDVPRMGKGMVLVKVEASLVSPGTEVGGWHSFANLIKTRMQKVSGEIIIVYGKRDI